MSSALGLLLVPTGNAMHQAVCGGFTAERAHRAQHAWPLEVENALLSAAAALTIIDAAHAVVPPAPSEQLARRAYIPVCAMDRATTGGFPVLVPLVASSQFLTCCHAACFSGRMLQAPGHPVTHGRDVLITDIHRSVA
jgi:hypothetical protein